MLNNLLILLLQEIDVDMQCVLQKLQQQRSWKMCSHLAAVPVLAPGRPPVYPRSMTASLGAHLSAGRRAHYPGESCRQFLRNTLNCFASAMIDYFATVND